MKRTYEKPEIIFEDFSLSTNIAGDCDVTTGTQSQGACPYTVTKGPLTWNIFLSSVAACTTHEDFDGTQDDMYNGICYHVPYGDNLFNS